MIGKLLLIVVGISSGVAVAGGLFAFIVAIGIVQRMIVRTDTARNIYLYESAIIWGGICGNILYLFNLKLPIGYVGVISYGLFSGTFIGVQAMALAEVLKTLPILAMRLKIKEGLPYIIVAMALGKMVGSIMGLCFAK